MNPADREVAWAIDMIRNGKAWPRSLFECGLVSRQVVAEAMRALRQTKGV